MRAVQGGNGGNDKGRDGSGKAGGEEGEREREMAKAALTIAELGQSKTFSLKLESAFLIPIKGTYRSSLHQISSYKNPNQQIPTNQFLPQMHTPTVHPSVILNKSL